jgi:hypothetical protein
MVVDDIPPTALASHSDKMARVDGIIILDTTG